MATAMLTDKGQVVIPAEIRARYELTPGTQVEFVDDGGTITLLIRRRVTPSDPATGYGMIKVKVKSRAPGSKSRRLSEFDPASMLMRQGGQK